MKLGQLSCWISVGGIYLSEHGVEIDEDKGESSAWVPSKPGWSFTVHWHDPDRTRATSGRIKLDGKDYGGTILRETRSFDEIKKSSVNFSPTEARPFHFSNLEFAGASSLCSPMISAIYQSARLLDNDTLLKKESDCLGSITLRIWRVSVVGQAEYSGNKVSDSIACQMHERAKNGLEYAIRFGDVRSAPIRGVEVDYLDETPIATFTFRYRSLDTLCSKGLVKAPLAGPRSDTPARASSNTSSGSTTSTTSAPTSRKRRASALDSPEPEEIQDDKADTVTIVHLEKLEDELRQAYANFFSHKGARKYLRKAKRAKLEEGTTASSGEVVDLPEVHE
ncbi:uncharacterized protein SCHCODRAFT_02556117 [Schizophyllum commune H4-8]|nr:uncharacterized protein SCHCODRAFT_02556117 [Schizophyllum commune H4-8]KAI5885857.1 hypothetical protein SCHCODRAFT_02556117 [Schizophyllum commune H4-8]